MLKLYLYRRYYRRGTSFLQQKRWREAESHFRNAIKLKPEDSWSHNNLAIALLKLGHFEESATTFERAIQLNPGFAESLENLGAALTKLYRWEEAVTAYRGALALDPTRLASSTNLGNALFHLKRWREAIVAFEAAIELDSTDPELFRALGAAYFQTEDGENTASAYCRSLALNPNDPKVYAEFATVLTKLDSPPNLRKIYQNTPELPSNSSAIRLEVGVELLRLKKWEDAVLCLQRAGSRDPDYACCQFLIVDPLIRLGHFKEAAAAHRRALDNHGQTPSIPSGARGLTENKRDISWNCENLSPNVFRVTQWLEQLVTVSVSPRSPEKPDLRSIGPLLFILDNDYGELTTLMYLLLGQPLAKQATLLLPERLYATNPDDLPGRTHPYTSKQDILRIIESVDPKIVFFCSGYLFSIHQILSLEDLDDLAVSLRDRSCTVVTTDPFLGMLSRQDPQTLINIDIPTESDFLELEKVRKVKEAQEKRLLFDFSYCQRLFRNAPHLYPALGEVPPTEVTATDLRNYSFFNTELLCPEIAVRQWEETGHFSGRPHWLFLLSQTDYEAQDMFVGPRFADIVATKLVESLAANRHPILIGPDKFIHSVVSRMPTFQGVSIHSFCPFNRLMSLVLSAEFVFYWNIVSHSILIRLYNKLPVILFDKGHLVRNVPAMYDRVIQWYYQGWEPEIYDHRIPLTHEAVSKWAAEFEPEADCILDGYRRAPTPAQMISKLSNVKAPAIG